MSTRQNLFSIILSFYVIFGMGHSGFAEGFSKHPYLQNVKPDEITICWEIEEAGDTTDLENYKVEYGIGVYSEVVSYPDAYPTEPRLFQLTLTGLQPGALYQYRVQSRSVWSDEATFLTAIDGEQPFTFAVYGDSRSGGYAHKKIAGLIKSWSPNLIIHTGDLWNNDGDDWGVKDFFAITKDLLNHIPLFPVLGNHEYWTRYSGGHGPFTEPEQYRKYFVLPMNLTSTEGYYSFGYGNAHFLVVDTNREESLEVEGSDYRVGSPQYAAIKRDLIHAAGNPDIVYIFVAMHKPAHSNGQFHGCGGSSMIEDPAISRDLGQLFQTYDVDIVFAGHDHHYERFQPVDNHHQPVSICDPPGDPADSDHPCNTIHEGVTYVVTGGGGVSVRGVDDSGTTEDCPEYDADCELPIPPLTSIIAESIHHAILLSVDGEEVKVEVKRTDGSMLDQFTIYKK
ncbi:MAG: metallophosphoesterase family protein, partial [bacterium]|nr:metallophosphoesterase family protein [bacterium]